MNTAATEPKRIWWARPRKLCALERPGGGGRSHRAERRSAEIAWLQARAVRLVVSTMATRHNLAAHEAVAARTADERVVASETEKPVVARFPDDDVVPAASDQPVIPTRPLAHGRAHHTDCLS
jgi:hypothetical protein